MTPVCPSRESTRSGWRANIAGSLDRRAIVRWRCRCRLPITMRACRWRIGCICRASGLRTGARRRKARVPAQIRFKTKQEIALEQIRWACEAGIPRGIALMDADYGRNAERRRSITAQELTYVAGIQSSPLVWRRGSGPKPGRKWPKWGRRGNPDLISVKEVARGLPEAAWQTIEWREGTADLLSSRFAR